MTYLTRHQARALSAANNYVPRKLSPLEIAIRQLVKVNSEKGTMSSEHHKESIRQVRRNIEAASTNFRILEAVDEAIKSAEAMQTLLEMFPYVEFEEAIFHRRFTGLQLAAFEGVTRSSLVTAFNWLAEVHALGQKLALGYVTFIGTNDTNYAAMRLTADATGHPEYRGMVLAEPLRAEVKRLFGNVTAFQCQERIKRYGLMTLPNAKEIFGVDVQDTTHGITSVIEFSTMKIGKVNEKVLAIILTVGGEIRAKYMFVI